MVRLGGAVAVLLTLFAASGVVAAEHPNGERFLYLCNATTGDRDGKARYAGCERYVKETRRSLENNAIHGLRACIPSRVPDLRLVFSAIRWAEDNPSSRRMEADEILARAFSKSWPC